jgi:hypothetical protein
MQAKGAAGDLAVERLLPAPSEVMVSFTGEHQAKYGVDSIFAQLPTAPSRGARTCAGRMEHARGVSVSIAKEVQSSPRRREQP